jgi:hypothetical protein
MIQISNIDYIKNMGGLISKINIRYLFETTDGTKFYINNKTGEYTYKPKLIEKIIMLDGKETKIQFYSCS